MHISEEKKRRWQRWAVAEGLFPLKMGQRFSHDGTSYERSGRNCTISVDRISTRFFSDWRNLNRITWAGHLFLPSWSVGKSRKIAQKKSSRKSVLYNRKCSRASERAFKGTPGPKISQEKKRVFL